VPNFDPLILGDFNNASRPTRLFTTGNAGGDNFAALIVRKSGQPAGDAALIANSENDGKVGVIGRAKKWRRRHGNGSAAWADFKSAQCAYRLVSRRKDIAAPRLAKVKLSKSVKHPQLPRHSRVKMPDSVKRSLTAPLVAASPDLPPAPQVPKVRAPEIPLAGGEEGPNRSG
jgi:hypothetical protein